MDRSDPTTRPIAVWRLIGAGLSLVLAGVAVWFAIEASRGFRTFAEAGAAEPVRMSVDLSRPGEVEAVFRHTHDSVHGVTLWASGEAIGAGGEQPLAGLRGEAVIFDDAGTEVTRAAIDPDGFLQGADGWRLVAMSEPAKGDYRMVLRIDDGAVGLPEGRVDVVGRYWQCGCEALPAALTRLLAWVAGILAAGVGLPSWGALLLGGLHRT